MGKSSGRIDCKKSKTSFAPIIPIVPLPNISIEPVISVKWLFALFRGLL